ncbi:glycosyltransferase family 2 protein [Basfia succiniciproducens]|uniref:glycosyltransferase family 2 protein n=1 Tax=Basfia succiniciproducens TaxID=653940 RepID=UPI0008C9579B|nr:glycosyltransferase family 2 protein [Basfia succiniciproducens]SEP68631.1 rhamnopyranosyl-N-acetylglucosaminyl-diphospho-decaprenol beta-1,3/1,4-galactofuranosyltransferase [Basfia succiniciproducens]
MNQSICAVVVTYNRKELLLNCLRALNVQSHPLDHIVVVNNASQDGTVEFLQEQGWQDNDKFTLINLTENQGGAGGFYAGIKYGAEHNFDYVWLMDDDGYPASDCLEKMLPYVSDDCYLGPMVLDVKDKERLSFAMRIPGTSETIDNYSQISRDLRDKNLIQKIVLPFNGTLIASKLIKTIGYPMKDYFIWGDEREYTARALKQSKNLATVIDAIFYHPADSSTSVPMFFGKMRFNYANSDLKMYCFCRNTIATFNRHNGWLHILGFWIKATWFSLFTKPSLSRLFFCWRAMWHGLIKDFSHHQEYIK